MAQPIPTPSDRPWEGERVVDHESAQALLETEFPELSPVALEPVSSGWDNTARPMATFVRDLHRVTVEAAWDVPPDLWGRFNLKTRLPQIRSFVTQLKESGYLSTGTNFDFILESVEGLPQPTGCVLTHGDLDARHWLVQDKRLVGAWNAVLSSHENGTPSIGPILSSADNSGPGAG